MRAIPPNIREKLALDPFMKRCCLCGKDKVKIDWHHNLEYAGKQQSDPTTILPLCTECHGNARDSRIKEELDLIMFHRGTDVYHYPKAALGQRRNYLYKKYGQIDIPRFGAEQKKQ